MKKDIYQEITDKMIASLEAGTTPWTKSWNSSSLPVPHNASSNTCYNGVNVLICWMAGFESNGWMTYAQAKKLGAQVRKGEKSTSIIYYNVVTKNEGKADESKFAMMKTFNVFNVEQIDGLPVVEKSEHKRTDVVELAEKLKADVLFNGKDPCYIPSVDQIQMPVSGDFKTEADFDATLLHELVHWTKHSSRLDRNMDSYAIEELVAEMGAAFSGARIGLPIEELQHDSYIASWLKALKNDNKMIFKAAKEAQKATKFLLGS